METFNFKPQCFLATSGTRIPPNKPPKPDKASQQPFNIGKQTLLTFLVIAFPASLPLLQNWGGWKEMTEHPRVSHWATLLI